MLNVIGLSAYYHDSACCLLSDGRLVAAAQEERFSRKKHDASLPRAAFRYCLEQGGLNITDVDCVAYYERPRLKLERQIWTCFRGVDLAHASELWRSARRPEREIRVLLGYDGPIEYVEHHQAHAASSFFYSGFEEAAIMTIDAVGEWATTTYGYGQEGKIALFDEVRFPDSLGLLYSAVTSYLGFSVNDGEYKVMGLAPYGRPAYVNQFASLLEPQSAGQFRLNLDYFDFISKSQMFSHALPALFGQERREPEMPITQFHKDVARSLQNVTEDLLVEKARYLHSRTGCENLCLAGGVALNCVANSKVLRQGPFRRLFVQPAAGDAGTSLGAASLVHVRLGGAAIPRNPLQHVFLGPAFSSSEIQRLLKAIPLEAGDFRGDEDALLEAAVERLAQGKILGWFNGRMEFGPRSLGARSILADPRIPEMRDRINALVKKRESFRPFAPAVSIDKMQEHFDLGHSSPFMLETCQVTSRLDLPAITHVDGSARIQTVDPDTNPRFYGLLQAFDRRTGCPVLLNTSFNMRDEPIVCTPQDALLCFARSRLDTLVLQDFIIDSSDTLAGWMDHLNRLSAPARSGISHDVYTLT